MTPSTLQTVKATIASTAGAIGSIVDTIDPQFHVAVVLGTAIAEAAPDLVNDVEQWIANRTAGLPSDEENAALAQKIVALLAPESPGLA